MLTSRTLARRRLVLAGAALLALAQPLALPRLLPARAQPAPDSAAAMKTAAAARVQHYSRVPIVRIDITRVVGDFATVRVYPPPNVTDPATVFLKRENSGWTAVAGPGTAFMLAEDVPGAPESLYPYQPDYAGQAGEAAIAALPTGRATYDRAPLFFQFPSDAQVGLDGDTIRLVGPYLTTPPFTGPAYEVSITPLGVSSNGPLDEWGYARMQQEIAQRQREGGPNTQPEGASFYTAGNVDVWEIDWFGGDSQLRALYVTPKGGGPVYQINTRAYPVQNNPAAPQAQGAVALLLQTLRIDG